MLHPKMNLTMLVAIQRLQQVLKDKVARSQQITPQKRKTNQFPGILKTREKQCGASFAPSQFCGRRNILQQNACKKSTNITHAYRSHDFE